MTRSTSSQETSRSLVLGLPRGPTARTAPTGTSGPSYPSMLLSATCESHSPQAPYCDSRAQRRSAGTSVTMQIRLVGMVALPICDDRAQPAAVAEEVKAAVYVPERDRLGDQPVQVQGAGRKR